MSKQEELLSVVWFILAVLLWDKYRVLGILSLLKGIGNVIFSVVSAILSIIESRRLKAEIFKVSS